MSMATDEERTDLERERDFLLQSLDDLEAERAAGSIDDESYAELHDDYTARAAATLRALRDGVDARPVGPAVSWQRRGVIIGGLVAFAAVAAIALAFALGARLPGQTSSGNTEVAASTRRDRLEAAVEARPDDVGAHLALARFLEREGATVDALKAYDAAVEAGPDNADALANAGRLAYIVGGQLPSEAGRTRLLERARSLLDRAVVADPDFADAHYYRGVMLLDPYGETDAAVAEFQRYLVLEPAGLFAEPARDALAQAGADAPGSDTVPPST
jgi:cytochrome c-type biogenesis protein CcmH